MTNTLYLFGTFRAPEIFKLLTRPNNPAAFPPLSLPPESARSLVEGFAVGAFSTRSTNWASLNTELYAASNDAGAALFPLVVEDDKGLAMGR